jgi:hypothetical protein
MTFGARDLSLRGRISLLAFVDATATSAAYLLGFLGLPLLFVVWNVSMMVVILLWEREEAGREVAGGERIQADEQATKVRTALAEVERCLSAKPAAEQAALLKKRKSWLLNELRRLEWALKEAELNSLARVAERKGIPLERAARILSTDESDGRAEDEENLKRMIDNAESILRREPEESLSYALKPVLNEITALYNDVGRRNRHSPMLVEYWAAWAVIKSIEEGVGADGPLSRTPKPLRQHLVRLVNASKAGGRRQTRVPQSTDKALAI